MILYYYIIHVFKYIALGIGVVALLRPVRMEFWLKSVIGTTLVVFLIHLCAAYQNELFGFDFRIFRNAGCDAWAGMDPFSKARSAEHELLVNPPTCLPLFVAFALLPFRTSLSVWTILNVVAILALPVLCWIVLRFQYGNTGSSEYLEPTSSGAPIEVLAGVAICLIFSEAAMKGFLLGQLSVFTAVMVLTAIAFQARNRPVWAGICLFLATVKIATMLPFLLLFLRRADRWSWAVLATLVLAACLMTGKPGDLPARLAILNDRIARLAAPGNVNDYSYAGTRNESIISFEHLFYRLGMRDRDLMRYAQLSALLVIGAWILWLVVPGRLRRFDAACLITFFSMLFLYHRDYDTVILVLPLVHCAEGANDDRPGPPSLRRVRPDCHRRSIHECGLSQNTDSVVVGQGYLGTFRAGNSPALLHLVDSPGDHSPGPGRPVSSAGRPSD